MKKLAYLILSIVAGSTLISSPVLAQAKKAEKKAEASPAASQGKITKEQAERLVLKKYPGAKIVNCDEKTANGSSVWIVSFTQTGGNIAQKVQVDEQTGKLTRL